MSSQSDFNVLTNQSQSDRPNVKLSVSIRSEVNAISPLVDTVLALIRKCQCVPRRRHEVELALREALANAVLHGNRQDTGKKVYVCCCIQFSGELSIIVKDEGAGFDHTQLPDPTAVENIKFAHGRGIYLMRALMDDVRFEQGGTEVHMRMRLSRRDRDRR